MVIDVAKNRRRKSIPKSQHCERYLVIIGVILFLIGFCVMVFARQQVIAGAAVLLLGMFICIVGLSKHSLHLLKRRAGKN